MKDHIVYARKCLCARRMPVIQRPAANHRIEPLDQLPGCEVSALVLDGVADPE
jgi:hypothetical protein